jgi:hypothetical protein
MEQSQLDQMSQQGGGLIAGVLGLIYFVLIILTIIGLWKVFTKAGEPGWASIVPIYNLVVLLKITGKPLWWIVLCFIPCVNLVILIMLGIAMAKAFGKAEGYGIGLALLPFIFYPLLGFSDAPYVGTKTA